MGDWCTEIYLSGVLNSTFKDPFEKPEGAEYDLIFEAKKGN